MRTVVTIPDPIFEEAEDLASRRQMSRSQLYAEALREYLQRHEPLRITEKLNELCEELGQDDDGFNAVAAAQGLRRVDGTLSGS